MDDGGSSRSRNMEALVASVRELIEQALSSLGGECPDRVMVRVLGHLSAAYDELKMAFSDCAAASLNSPTAAVTPAGPSGSESA